MVKVQINRVSGIDNKFTNVDRGQNFTSKGCVLFVKGCVICSLCLQEIACIYADVPIFLI